MPSVVPPHDTIMTDPTNHPDAPRDPAIRPVAAGELPHLHALWDRSVRATHDFVTEADMEMYSPLITGYLASGKSELWVLEADDGDVMGFMGLAGTNIDLLFFEPHYLRRGGGRRLVDHARALRPNQDLTVDCNEQNPEACRFYEAYGFVVERWSEKDDTGRP